MSRRNSKAPPTREASLAAKTLRGGQLQPTSSTDEIARNVLAPTILAANTIAAVLPISTPLDIQALTNALGEQTRKAIDGDLSRADAMLVAQAHTLNAIFTALTDKSPKSMS